MRLFPRLFTEVVVAALFVGLVAGTPAHADSLRIAPLEYRTTLKAGEKQKGYVDISNPEANTVDVKFETQAFRQIDNSGNIEFYNDEAVSAGILLDLDSIEMGPHEVLRLVFFIDGTKLPQGEVFAAILAHTVPRGTSGTTQSVRVGTILEITNGDEGTHHAVVDNFSAPFLQIGDKVSMQFSVRNKDSSSAFRPTITAAIAPYSTQKVAGPLVFAGRSRQVEYRFDGNYFGFVWLKADVQDSSAGQLSFVMTGYWRWLGPLTILSGISLIILAVYMRRSKR